MLITVAYLRIPCSEARVRSYARFGLGALEYANDCYKAAGKEKGKKVTALKKRIAEVKKRLEAQAF